MGAEVVPLWQQSHLYMQSAPRINLGQASEAPPGRTLIDTGVTALMLHINAL